MLSPVISELECVVVDEDGSYEPGLIHMSDFGTIEVYEGSREFVVEPGTREIVVPDVTVAHEMVHLANELRGVKDCNGNQYHNKHFRDACEKVGLACEPRDPITGYGQTYLIWDFERLIKQMDIDESVFSANRKAPPKRKKRKRSEPYPKKWMCGCTEITCPETVTALCENCGREFKRPEDYRASLRAEEEFLSRFSLFG